MSGGRLLALATLVGTAVTSCGGNEGEPFEREEYELADTGPRRATDCSADDGVELHVIDDFERGAAANAFANNEVCAPCPELEGEPRASCEQACRASQFPTDFDKPLPAELIPGGRCGSNYALHVTTEQFYEYGGLIGFPFSPPFDARKYDGVAFWGRVAWGSRSTLRMVVVDPETDSTYTDPETGGPRCEADSNLDDFADACDPFGTYAILDGDWHFFLLPFDEMRQRGFGHIGPFIDLGAIRQVSVEYGLGAWDFWIDDLAFYRTSQEGSR